MTFASKRYHAIFQTYSLSYGNELLVHSPSFGEEKCFYHSFGKAIQAKKRR